jgi:membrane carboxypeptidase/penicillin-binding protein PbpC
MHNVTGLTGAAPIWHEVMRGLLQGRPDHPFERPDGLTQVEVCAVSGLLPTSACTHTRTEWFIAGTEPTQTDTTYQQVWIDANFTDDLIPRTTQTTVLISCGSANPRTQDFLAVRLFSNIRERFSRKSTGYFPHTQLPTH